MGEETSAAHYKKMFDRISTLARIGVWECSLSTGHLTWTDMVYDIFGIPRGAPIDRDATLRLYEPKSRREMEWLRDKAIRSGTGFMLDIQILPSASEVRWIRLTAEVEQEAGRAVRIFGTKQDITSEKAAHDRLQSVQTELIHLSRGTAMGAMASTMAHELNQPLAALSAYLSAVRRIASRENVSSELNEGIDGALEATHRAGHIIRSVRAMVANQDAKKKHIELEVLLKEAANIATIGIQHLSVTYEIASSFVVFVDSIQIQQVMINLIRNACEAAGGSTCHIIIKALPKNSHVEVCVIDDGPGIPDDIIAEIFDAFVSTTSAGLGIGLSVSRTIIEAHGGHISAANLPGRGASICFTLPRTLDRRKAN